MKKKHMSVFDDNLPDDYCPDCQIPMQNIRNKALVCPYCDIRCYTDEKLKEKALKVSLLMGQINHELFD